MKTTDKYVFFWKSKLAQWNMQSFVDVNDIEYCCAEQYMMAEKARLFGDSETCQKIMSSKNPKDIQNFGRLVKNFNQGVWDAHKQIIVYQCNILKFSQNQDLLDLLLSTAGKTLVEASPIDRIWGIGLSEDEPDDILNNPENWKGQNLLGYTLTMVRQKYFGVE